MFIDICYKILFVIELSVVASLGLLLICCILFLIRCMIECF